MVFTVNQTRDFYENANQMAIPNATVIQLANEGILTVADLSDFDKQSIKQIADNLRRPGGRVQDPTPGATVGATIPTPPFVFGSKSQTRLEVAGNLVRFYNTINRVLTPSNVAWSQVMSNFKELWKVIVDRKSSENPDTPKISNALPIIRWTEAFRDHCHRCIGKRHIPLAYVIRKDVTVPALCPALATDQPYTELYGSIEEDLIHRASHTHGLYRNDNAVVYYKLEEATRGTVYADSIKPFQRKKDGRGAFEALTKQYAGVDKWEAEIKKQSHLLHTRKWKGQSNFTLEKFVQQHRNAYVSMQACSQHVDYQLPNELTRVRYLLDALENDDAGLQAAMASVEQDSSVGGMRSDFELAAAHLLPKDPVVKKRLQAGKRSAADIASTSASVSAPKKGIGSSGVHFRYYKPDEYDKLNKAQKKELSEWRQSKGTFDGKAKKKPRTESKSAMVAAIRKQVEEQMSAKLIDAQLKKDKDEGMKTYIMSLFSNEDIKLPSTTAAIGATSATPPAAPPSENVIDVPDNVTLANILKMAKNAKGSK